MRPGLGATTDAEDHMRLNRIGWSVVALSVLGAAFAQAVLAVEGTPHNGLSSQAFRLNALTSNKTSLEILTTHPLNEMLFSVEDNYIGRQLHDPRTMAMMKELVKCALDTSTTVISTVISVDEQRHTEQRYTMELRGELGLCQKPTTDVGDWSLDPPTEACQELVTACLMARVNALGKSIPLSLRSQRSVLSLLSHRVHTETRFRESPMGEDPSEGTPIDSFSSYCVQGECNWAAAYVGTCIPGTQLELAIQDPPACGSATLRVCAGIHGCFGSSSLDRFVPNGASLLPYSELPYSKLVSQTSGCSLKFTCPHGHYIGGYYSVMTQSPLTTSAASKVTGSSSSGRYPAQENEVFTFAEGAFYGNLFKPEKLKRDCTVNEDMLKCLAVNNSGFKEVDCGIGADLNDRKCNEAAESILLPYTNVYACYIYAQQKETKNDDRLGTAALNSRICDFPDSDCFPNKPQRCHYYKANAKEAGSGPKEEGGVCSAMGSDGAYANCRGQGGDSATRYREIITTYLNDPCDLINDSGLCEKMRESITPGHGGELQVATGRGGCGRCSVDAAGDAFQPASLASLVALLLHRRRRHRAG